MSSTSVNMTTGRPQREQSKSENKGAEYRKSRIKNLDERNLESFISSATSQTRSKIKHQRYNSHVMQTSVKMEQEKKLIRDQQLQFQA